MAKIRGTRRESDVINKIEVQQHLIFDIADAEKEVRRAFANLNQKIIELNRLYLEDGREPVDVEDLVFHYMISQSSLDGDDKEIE